MEYARFSGQGPALPTRRVNLFIIMKRILIVNVNWIGDTLFATPLMRALRDNLPDAYIAVLTHPRCHQILEGNPNINEVILYNDRYLLRRLPTKFSLISLIRSKEFDTSFILRRSLSRTMLMFLCKIPQRIGYDNRKSGFLLTKRVKMPAKNLHRVEYFLDLARSVGIEPKSANYEFFVSDKDRDKADEILQREGLKGKESFIAINAGGNWDLKRWPVEDFAELGDEIFDRFNTKVVLTGAEKDIGLCKNISNLMRTEPVLLCGKTDLKTLGAVFEKAKWVISNDSGPMHIAIGVKSPVIALFGPTSPSITGPYGDSLYKVLQKKVDCDIPCYNLSCKDNKCMKAITLKDVLEAMA